jgi:predicted secreted protein
METVAYNATSSGLTNLSSNSFTIPIFGFIIFGIAAFSVLYASSKSFRIFLDGFLDFCVYSFKDGIIVILTILASLIVLGVFYKIFTDTGIQRDFLKPLMLFGFVAVALVSLIAIVGAFTKDYSKTIKKLIGVD